MHCYADLSAAYTEPYQPLEERLLPLEVASTHVHSVKVRKDQVHERCFKVTNDRLWLVQLPGRLVCKPHDLVGHISCLARTKDKLDREEQV